MIRLPAAARQFFAEHIQQVFDSGTLAEGPWNEAVADWACKYTGAKFATTTGSNGGGMFAVLSLLRRYRGYTHALIQSNTMYGVKTMVVSAGLELAGTVGCSLDFLVPTPGDVASALRNVPDPARTVLVLSHIGGWTNPEIEAIAEACAAKGVALVEDCAHSLGATLDGRHSGLHGIAGVYSLYATKAIPAGEGGIVVTDDAEMGSMVPRFVIYDRFKREMDIGLNVRMSEVSALLAFSVLRETESIIADKMAVARRYMQSCDRVGIDYIRPETPRWRANLYKFIVLDRNSPVDTLRIDGIKSRTSSVYDYALGPDAAEIVRRHACLPIWYLLDEAVIEKTCREIESC